MSGGSSDASHCDEGTGFIGLAVIRRIIDDTDFEELNLDHLTYAGNPNSIASIEGNDRYHFSRTDIRDMPAEREAMRVFDLI
ncbi:hypothetical protein [Parvibaculum sp.]|uniref:hypothetical protein n=1 Tax=Parvibaculum sp. TaxID=2024848 RepID=UPI003298A726